MENKFCRHQAESVEVANPQKYNLEILGSFYRCTCWSAAFKRGRVYGATYFEVSYCPFTAKDAEDCSAFSYNPSLRLIPKDGK